MKLVARNLGRLSIGSDRVMESAWASQRFPVVVAKDLAGQRVGGTRGTGAVRKPLGL